MMFTLFTPQRIPALALAAISTLALSTLPRAAADEPHHHPAPERLGTVTFPTTCSPAVQPAFERAVALLHSFTYTDAEAGFLSVAQQDPHCAIAYWGAAMTHYHQLWDLPPSPADTAAGARLIAQALQAESPTLSARERGFIAALNPVFTQAATLPYPRRALLYETALGDLAAANPGDAETQVFYALALISNAPPTDRQHLKQKQAAAILAPLFRQHPDHPGLAHYLIHADDNQEMAPDGLPAARLYAGIAPSAPHALHMPSHIFTRLGMWQDSIASNLAARDAAQRQGDPGEQLHAMDYLVYAYLQLGQDREADAVLRQLQSMPALSSADAMASFKIGYAATAMPVRRLVERQLWTEAETLPDPPPSAQPHVVAITTWARGLGHARNGHPDASRHEIAALEALTAQLRSNGDLYWAAQVDLLSREVAAWTAQAEGLPAQALALLRSAADDEDAVEKLPVTPGPILPAREQLGQLLLLQHNPAAAAKAFATALTNAPGHRNALAGAALASH